LLGPTEYGGAADAVVLVLFVIVLALSLRSGSLKLRRIGGEEGTARSAAAGPISKEASVLRLAMGGDYASRAEIARILGDSIEPNPDGSPFGGDESALMNPPRPEPGRSEKATKASREMYLRSVEEALSIASPEVSELGH